MTIDGICKDVEVFKENVLGRIKAVNKTARENTKDIEEIKRDYVTKIEFDPIKSLVYGLVGIIITTVIGAILKLVFMQ